VCKLGVAAGNVKPLYIFWALLGSQRSASRMIYKCLVCCKKHHDLRDISFGNRSPTRNIFQANWSGNTPFFIDFDNDVSFRKLSRFTITLSSDKTLIIYRFVEIWHSEVKNT